MLKYIKVNNNLIPFKEGLNIISCIPAQTEGKTNNNIGKTTLVHILQAIYGQRKIYPITQALGLKIKKAKKICRVEWCFIIDSKSYTFLYDIEEMHQVFYDGELISLEEYKSMIGALLDNRVKIFRDNINIDSKFIRKTNDNCFISEAFPHRNQSYVAFFMIKILFYKWIDKSSLRRIEKYFEKVAKRNSYSNIRSKYHNEIIDQIMDLEDTEKFIKLDKLNKELNKYKTISIENIDYDIVNEIKELKLNIDIDEVIEFHRALIKDYSSIIDSKIAETNNQINHLKNSISEISILDYSQSDIDIALEVSEFLKNADAELKNDYKEIMSEIDMLVEIVNFELRKINENINKSLDGNITSDNNFSLGSTYNDILQSLKFSLKLSDTTGDSNKYINALILYSYILKLGKINMVAFDTIHTSEITPINLNTVLSHIKEIIGTEQYLVLLFDNSIDEQKFSKEIIFRIGSGRDTLLGYSV